MTRIPKRANKKSSPSTAPPSTFRFPHWAVVGLAIVFAFIVRVRLLDIPLERDEGEYAYAGQLLLQGVPPYQAAFNMKFPGVYAAYAAIMAIFGQTVAGIHLGFLLLNAGTIVLVFLLGRRLFSPAAGAAAAAAYALLSVSYSVYGTQAHATHFVVAAALGATLLLLRAIDAGSARLFFLAGLLYGVTILMKQHGAFFAIFAGLYLLWTCGKRPAWSKLGLLVAGSAVPLALTALALWIAGVFSNFWFWTVTYARGYTLENSLADGIVNFKTAFPLVVGPNLLLWILAAAGLALLWWKNSGRAPAVFASAFLVFSFLAVCPGLYFREHYFVLMLPAIALLAGAALDRMRRIAPSWIAGLVFAAALVISIAQQTDFLFGMTASEAEARMYGLNPFSQAIEVANYLREHSEKSARIAVLGSEPEIYFYANRRSATGYIYTYGMMEPQPFAMKMQNQMIAQLESARPEYVVYVSVPFSWAQRRDSPRRIFDWWSSYGARNYKVVGVADMISPDHTEYHWDNLESFRPTSQIYIAVCKRTS